MTKKSRNRKMILIKLKKRSLRRKHPKARKKLQPVPARLQRRRKARNALRKANVFIVVVAEVVIEVLQNRTSSLPHVNLQR